MVVALSHPLVKHLQGLVRGRGGGGLGGVGGGHPGWGRGLPLPGLHHQGIPVLQTQEVQGGRVKGGQRWAHLRGVPPQPCTEEVQLGGGQQIYSHPGAPFGYLREQVNHLGASMK